MRTKLPVCPKCRSRFLKICEKTECWTEFVVEKDGKVDWENGDMVAGDVAGVWGVCLELQCAHTWRMRGLVSVSDLQDFTE